MPKQERERLDLLLVELGLCASRARAQALIMAGKVLVEEQPVTKAGARVERSAGIRLKEPEHPFASRGGVKLAGALEDLALSVQDAQILDVGASTGGFTDCLLQHGAQRVFALDVGRGQLDWKLQQDSRVVRLDGINARHLEPGHLPGPVDLATIDVSFISLRLVLGPVARVVRPGGKLLALVKPQFELQRSQVGKGGVVRDDGLRRRAVEQICEHAESIGLRALGQAECRLAGADGNREIFLLLGVPE